jgi:hypothetical protein
MRDVLIRIVKEALWAPIAVLVLRTVAAPFVGNAVDPVMHFLGGVAVAFFVRRSAQIASVYVGSMKPLGLDLLAVGLTCLIALLWEFGEYLSDVWFGTNTHPTVAHTLADLAFGVAGAVTFVAIHALWRRGASSTP